MTYSGQLMLVACTATARILFRKNDRIWAVAGDAGARSSRSSATLTRSAWIGACAGIGLLFLIRDLRFVALLPVVAALFMAFGPTQLTDRLYSSFRLDKLRHDSADDAGRRAVEPGPAVHAEIRAADHQGPPADGSRPRRGAGGLPAIPASPAPSTSSTRTCTTCRCRSRPSAGCRRSRSGCGSSSCSLRDFIVKRKTTAIPSLATAALASVVAMLAAGMFEYNFGDSEFLMLFLVIVTLPYAADREASVPTAPIAPRRPRLRPRRRHERDPQDLPAAPRRPHRPHRRRPHARSLRVRPRGADLARRPRCRSSGSITRSTGSAAPPTSPTTSRRSAAASRSSASSGTTRKRNGCAPISRRLSIGTRGIVGDADRCTTRKLRVVTMRNQQVARIDYEDDREIGGAVEAAVIDRHRCARATRPMPSWCPTT